MGRVTRLAFLRAATMGSLAGAILALGGCAKIWGIDDGIPFPPPPDATNDVASGPDAADAADVVEEDVDASLADAAGGTDTGSVFADSTVDAPVEAMAIDAASEADAPIPDASEASAPEACTPDQTFCLNHCSPGIDSCGVQWNCGNNCPTGWGCNPATGTCVCSTFPTWCKNRCDVTTDNCGKTIDCGACQGGLACNNNTCGNCMAESNQVACGAQQCGSATNNCMQTVNCGVMGTTGCAPGQTCLSDQSCCTPGTCKGRCNTTLPDGCMGMLVCPAGICPTGQVCYQTNCCTPVNNCGNQCGITVPDGCGGQFACPACGCTPVNNCGNQCGVTVPDGCGGKIACPACPCTPTNSCGNQCGVSISDGCGGMVKCTCSGSASICYGGQCCIQNGTCGGNCIDNCGQFAQQCCQMTMDSGPPPMCAAKGQDCSALACCPGYSCVATLQFSPDSGGPPPSPTCQ